MSVYVSMVDSNLGKKYGGLPDCSTPQQTVKSRLLLSFIFFVIQVYNRGLEFPQSCWVLYYSSDPSSLSACSQNENFHSKL